MRKSIFETKNDFNLQAEYQRLKILLTDKWAIYDHGEYYSVLDYLDEYVFIKWDYRDTFTDIEDYLLSIGVDFEFDVISFESMLNFIEFIMNMWNLMLKVRKYNFDFKSDKVESSIPRNCKILVEKMGYAYEKNGENIILFNKDPDVESVLDSIEESIEDLFISYCDKRNNNLEDKKTILKKLDIYVEQEKKKFKQNNNSIYETIQVIMNNYGINHPVKKEKIKLLSDDELIQWYDQCFKMVIHLFRSKDISEYNDPRVLLD